MRILTTDKSIYFNGAFGKLEVATKFPTESCT